MVYPYHCHHCIVGHRVGVVCRMEDVRDELHEVKANDESHVNSDIFTNKYHFILVEKFTYMNCNELIPKIVYNYRFYLHERLNKQIRQHIVYKCININF